MAEPKTFRAYFFDITATGQEPIDRLLAKVCEACKGYHNHEGWTDEGYHGEPSYVEQIQTIAAEGANDIATLQAENTALAARVAELEGALTMAADEMLRLGNALSARGQGATMLGMAERYARTVLAQGENDG